MIVSAQAGKPRVLVIDDDIEYAGYIASSLADRFEPRVAPSAAAGLADLRAAPFEALVLERWLHHGHRALSLARLAKELRQDSVVVFTSRLCESGQFVGR